MKNIFDILYESLKSKIIESNCNITEDENDSDLSEEPGNEEIQPTSQEEPSQSAKRTTVNGITIEQKDWDRAVNLNKKGDNAVDTMRKLTKDSRKLLARAACLFAIANKKKEYNTAFRSFEEACKKAHVASTDFGSPTSYVWEEYYAERLLNRSSEDIAKVKDTKLSDLPFPDAVEMCKKLDEKIKAVNEKKDSLSGQIESNAQKAAEIKAKIKEIEGKVQAWKKEHDSWRSLYYKENAGWGYDTPAGKFRPYGTFELSHDPKADYLYWEYENLFNTSYYTDRYDFHTPSEMEHKECGYDEESLWKKLREGHPGYGTIHCYITIWRCPKLLQEYEALKRELSKVN